MSLYYSIIYSEYLTVAMYILLKLGLIYSSFKYGSAPHSLDNLFVLSIKDSNGSEPNTGNIKPSALLSGSTPSGSCLPSLDKVVEFKESDIAARRGLPSLKVRIPAESLVDISQRLLGNVEYNIELYKGQIIQFKSLVENIDNGTEKFYPKETRSQ
jgi:hypothetical protein